MPTPWATVIVPVYNTAAWLPAALASIDRQANRDGIEVMIVDDGSPDDSPRIAQKYAATAARTRYVRQANAGLGAARNHGMRLANGRYLAFLDSDDVYPPNGLSDLLALADAEDAPVAVGDMQGFPPRPSPIWRRELVTGQRVITNLAEAPDLVGNPSACNKVFRRDFVTAQQATFTEGTAFEDVLFTLPLLLRSPRTALTPRLAYLYRQRGDGSSIMDSRSQPTKIFQHLTVLERVASDLATVSPETRRVVQRWVAYMQLHYAERAATALDDEQLTEFTKRMAALFADIPVEVTAEYVPNLATGLRAVAIYEGDTDGIRKPAIAGPIVLHGGHPYASRPGTDRYRELLQIVEPTGGFTRLIGGQTPSLLGFVDMAGVTATPGEVRPDILLELGDTLVRRPITITGVADERLTWQVELPLSEVPPGSHRLRLVVRDAGVELVIPTGEGTLAGRPRAIGDRRTAWILANSTSPQLVIAGGPTATALHVPLWLANSAGTRGRNSAGRAHLRLKRIVRTSLRRG